MNPDSTGGDYHFTLEDFSELIAFLVRRRVGLDVVVGIVEAAIPALTRDAAEVSDR